MKKLSIFIILILIIGAIFYFWQGQNKFEPQDLSSGGNQISLSFQFSEENIQESNFEFKTPINLSEITEIISQQKSWAYKAEDYGDMGILVSQIGEKVNGQEQKYWQYFVDGQQTQISADKYFPTNDANIEWKFIKSEF